MNYLLIAINLKLIYIVGRVFYLQQKHTLIWTKFIHCAKTKKTVKQNSMAIKTYKKGLNLAW